MESKEVSGKQAIHYRNYRRARDRALVRLSHLYPNVYRDLLAEEKENDQTEGKSWVASSTRVSVTMGVRSRPTRNKGRATKRPKRGRKNKGNNGGKA
jgi:hypothetical protein